MTVYNVNLGIGWASSGVEYAQRYRDQSLKMAGIDRKFIFSDVILGNNIGDLTANIGFENKNIIWLYNYFTDIKISQSTYPLTKLEAEQKLIDRAKNVKKTEIEAIYEFPEDYKIVARFRNNDKEYIDQVSYIRNNALLKRDFYSYTKYACEYYLGTQADNRVTFREFYNEDGSVAYTQHLKQKKETFEFADGEVVLSKNDLYLKMLKSLDFTKNDVLILDREDEDENLINGQLIFENHGDAKLCVVVHADHYDKHYTTDKNVLWNNFYEYQFQHAKYVDSFIVATEKQRELLLKQFKKYYNIEPRVDCIPVGNLIELEYPEKPRKKYALITASRLAKEKHIDWLVNAVVAAKNSVPELTLDIYGTGGEAGMLDELIHKKNAQDYIHLMGQKDLTKIYRHYPAYIAASTSEGFGLSLLEAIGSGLAMIGFDVPYGNPTFIENGNNGILLPYDESWNDFKKEETLTKAIIKLFSEYDLAALSERSYEKAKPYITENISKKWQQLVEGVLND